MLNKVIVLFGFCFQDHKIFQVKICPKHIHSTIWICFVRTVSNCCQNHKQPSAAAGAPPRNYDVEMAGGDAGVETSGDAQDDDLNQGVVDEVTITPILQDTITPILQDS